MTTHYYVQRDLRQGERSYLVRKQSGRDPSALDVVVRQFDEREDAHAYATSMNQVEQRIHVEKGGKSASADTWLKPRGL